MKTKLLKKLRREAKLNVKIIGSPLYKNHYKIIRIVKRIFQKKDIETFSFPCYGTFFPNSDGSTFTSIPSAIKVLEFARRAYIYSRIYEMKQDKNKISNLKTI